MNNEKDTCVRAIILDTETNTLKDPEPLEISWVGVPDSIFNTKKAFDLRSLLENDLVPSGYFRFDVEAPISPTAFKIHNISKKDLKGLPFYKHEGHVSLGIPSSVRYIICHNAVFDRRVLSWSAIPNATYICTLKAAKQLLLDDPDDETISRTPSGARSYKLVSLIQDLFGEGKASVENAHSAKADVLMTARLLRYLIENYEISSFKDLKSFAKV